MKSTLTVLFLGLLFSSSVQSEGLEISCSNSPKEAVLKIPEPANILAHVICSKYGHIIHPVKGWIWTRPGGLSPLFFPSQMVRAQPKELNNNSYFKNIKVTELPDSVVKEKWSLIGAMFDGEKSTDHKALEIVASNNEGNKHTIYIFNNGWGYGCSPTCKKDSIFLLISQDKKDVVW